MYDMYWMQPETYRMFTSNDTFGQRIAGHKNIPNRLRYNAQIEDNLMRFYYMRVRYYNTGIGRFTQEEVIYNDGLNLYAYCSISPVMYADPSGYKYNKNQEKLNSYVTTKSAAENSNTRYNLTEWRKRV